jgi:peptidyl-prolyl cis-trans isomerase D
MRGDLIRQMLADAMTSGVRAPSSYGDLLYTYNAETRVVSVAMAMANTVGAIPAPTQEQLQTFWTDNQDALRLPEYRRVTLIYARPADFVSRVNITDQQLQTEFEQRRASLTQPERRTYVRVVAQNQAQATDVAERINRGESPQAVATALHLQMTNGTDEARTDVPDTRVADAIFSMPARAPARVVQGQLTAWAVVRVDSVTPAVQPNFAAVRDQIRQALATDQASDLLNTAVSAFEDARSAGTAAAAAARQQGFTVVTIPAVDAQGRDAAGQPVAALAGQREILQTAFQTPEGEASDFIPVTDADVVVAVEGVTPTRVRTLDEARAELTRAWTAREEARRLREKGEQLVAAVHGGQSFAAAARAARFNLVVSSHPMSRRDAGQIPARGLPAQIFAASEGDVLSDLRSDSGAVLVAVVEHINRPDPAAAPQDVEAARAQIEQSVQSSFAEAMTDQIVADAHPRRNEQLLQSTFQRTTEDPENQ